MNTYGTTTCPNCGAYNSMFRPLDIIKILPAWDKVNCYLCKHEYKHTDKINNITTEAEQIKNEGKY